MKFYEICFSPTGGTKKAADILSNELSSEIHPIDLTDSKIFPISLFLMMILLSSLYHLTAEGFRNRQSAALLL